MSNIRRDRGRPVTDKLEAVQEVASMMSLKEIVRFSQLAESIAPLLAQCACTMYAAMLRGKRFFLHGRDMDGVYMALAMWRPDLIEAGRMRYQVTSRSWISADLPSHTSFHRAVASLDKDVSYIHVDTGYSGSVPRTFWRRGFNVEAIWLVGCNTAAEHREIPLPLGRQAVWMAAAEDYEAKVYGSQQVESNKKSCKELGKSYTSELRQSVASWSEHMPHELQNAESEDSFEAYVSKQPGEPKFWLWAKHLRDAIDEEWSTAKELYKKAYDAYVFPEDNYLKPEDRGTERLWDVFDHRLADVDEMPAGDWRHTESGALPVLSREAWNSRVLPPCSALQAQGVALQHYRGTVWAQDREVQFKGEVTFEGVDRVRLLRRYYNGWIREQDLGRRMTPTERQRWEAKRDEWIKKLEDNLRAKYGEVVYKGGWFYCRAKSTSLFTETYIPF